MENITRRHAPFIFAIIALSIALQYPFLQADATFHKGDWRISHQNTVVIMKQALSEGALPFWTPLADSGMPFYAMPDKPFLYPPLLLMLTFFSAVASMNILIIIHMMMAGIFMYMLMYSILKDEKSAFIPALMFMVSQSVLLSPPFWRYTITYIPLLLFFLIKTFKLDAKKWDYSIATGITLALMLLGGGIFPFYYTCLFIAALFAAYSWIIEKDKAKTGRAILTAGAIMIIVFLGLTYLKIAPSNDWSNLINRAEGLGMSESKGTTLTLENFWGITATGITKETPYPLGIAGIILILLSLPLIKNKHALFFWIVLIAVILFASGFAYELLYKTIPGLSKQRGVTRALFIMTFSGAALAGFGMKYLLGKINYKTTVFFIFALAILATPFFSYFKPHHLQLESFNEQLDNNEITKYLSEQQKPFRMTSFDVTGIDWNDIETATIPLKIEETSHAFGGIWFTDYLQGFLALAYRENLKDYAKIFGILNVKYVVSSKELNLSGLELIRKFSEYKRAWPDFYDGPFLYSNTKAAPRAFYPKSKILVSGQPDQAKNAVRKIITDSNFDPLKTAVVRTEKATDSLAENFDAVILLDSQLKNYKGKTIKDAGELNALLASLGETEQADAEQNLEYTQNSLTIKNPQKGMIILSERYAMFPGWKAYADSTPVELYQADGIITAAIIPENTKTLKITYTPEKFVFGAWLAGATITAISAYFILSRTILSKKLNKRGEPAPAQHP